MPFLTSNIPIFKHREALARHRTRACVNRYDGLPFPTDLELVLAIKRRIETGCLEAAVGLVQQYRERLLSHPESQRKAKSL